MTPGSLFADEENDDIDDEEIDQDEQLYSFCEEEKAVVDRVIEIVREIARRPDITPRQMSQLGTLLFGLTRLPRQTKGLDMELTLQYSFNHESTWHSVHLDHDSFSLGSGGMAYDEAVGGDNYSSTSLEVGYGWRGDDPDWWDLTGWVEQFDEMVRDSQYEVNIESYTDDPFDWDQSENDDANPNSYWSKLSSSQE